jgi:5-methylcytosine-specific restriction endonuclease McrA
MSKFEIDEEELYDAVINSHSFTETVSRLGRDPSKDTLFLSRVKAKIKELNLDIEHWPRKGIKRSPQNISLETILVENSWYTNTTQLKERLIKENILENVCVECGIKDLWNGKVIVLQLDHINGNNRDHRLENLRILCPNCHSQTDTFCRGHKKVKKQ